MLTISDIPPLLAGLIVGFYWARVIKLVLKTRKLTGKAANFVPPEPLGRLLRILWYPTVVAWIVLPLIGAFWRDAPQFIHAYRAIPILHWAGLAIAIVAMGATLVCWKRMGKSWRMGIDPNEKTRLVFSGPFAYVRHPIYALSSILMLATLVAAPSPALGIAAFIHLLFLQWEARREERYLIQTHGATYEDYMRHVGRFTPRSLSPYRSTGG